MTDLLPTVAMRAEIAGLLRSRLLNKNLHEVASFHQITIEKAGRKNKGWVGQTLEKVACLGSGNLKERDGIDFELKSTTLLERVDGWKPKETIKVTQMNPETILEETFETSVLWQKLHRLIIVGVRHESAVCCQVVSVNCVDITEPALVGEIRRFWEDVQSTVFNGEIPLFPNLGSSKDLVQLRPVGHGKHWSRCPVTGERFPARAFYATKRLISEVLKL